MLPAGDVEIALPRDTIARSPPLLGLALGTPKCQFILCIDIQSLWAPRSHGSPIFLLGGIDTAHPGGRMQPQPFATYGNGPSSCHPHDSRAVVQNPLPMWALLARPTWHESLSVVGKQVTQEIGQHPLRSLGRPACGPGSRDPCSKSHFGEGLLGISLVASPTHPSRIVPPLDHHASQRLNEDTVLITLSENDIFAVGQ